MNKIPNIGKMVKLDNLVPIILGVALSGLSTLMSFAYSNMEEMHTEIVESCSPKTDCYFNYENLEVLKIPRSKVLFLCHEFYPSIISICKSLPVLSKFPLLTARGPQAVRAITLIYIDTRNRISKRIENDHLKNYVYE